MNKYNLNDILTKEVIFEENVCVFNGVQIPMIQRDYAQGREGEGEIRKRFLKAIFTALEKDEELELDFIYGAKKSIDNKDLFIPLDGQQRLTTLYLLNWYIGNRELETDKLKELRDSLGNFTYATRTSSNIFCETLSKISISFLSSPSEEIKNASWFFDTFELDPTVKSMLVMLDAIHEAYGTEKKDLFFSLSKIKFYFLPLDGFDLTDELYIKMNARGEQLTGFENFKADLLKWLKDKTNPFQEDFHNEVLFDNRLLEYYLCFEFKLDNNWTNLFWKFSKKKDTHKNKLVDPYLMQFWNRYLLNSFIINSSLNQDEFESNDIFKELYGNQGNDSNFKYKNFDLFKTILEKDNFIYKIEKVFGNFSKHIETINEIIKPNWDKNDKWELFSESINQRQRILLFSITAYLEENDFEVQKFKNWIRVVWNLIIDPKIRSVPAMIGAMRLISQLAEHSKDIYSYLRKQESVLLLGNSTYQEQLEEEHTKTLLINKADEWESLIIEAESHALFQGKIAFMLDNKGFLEFEDLKKNKKTAFQIFENNDLSDSPENYLWIRALLSKSVDENTITILPLKLSNGRFNDWRELINGPFIKGMQLLIQDLSAKTNTIKESLEEICKSYQINESYRWVYPLVNWVGNNGETLLGDFSITRRIEKYDYYGSAPKHIYLYNQTRWTEGNIILSNFRNELISELLRSNQNIKLTNEFGNIQNTYFRGWDIKLERIVGKLTFKYLIDKVFVTVGILTTSELESELNDVHFEFNGKDKDWFCKLQFDYSQIENTEFNSFLNTIENDIFNNSNSESVIFQLNKILKSR